MSHSSASGGKCWPWGKVWRAKTTTVWLNMPTLLIRSLEWNLPDGRFQLSAQSFQVRRGANMHSANLKSSEFGITTDASITHRPNLSRPSASSIAEVYTRVRPPNASLLARGADCAEEPFHSLLREELDSLRLGV